MARRYTFDELNVTTRPRICKGVWSFGHRVYHWRCKGRASTGYGTTPTEAYYAWLRNWARRYKWYQNQFVQAQLTLRSLGR